MKRILSLLLLILAFGILSACSTIEDVSNSINYIEEATDYINKVNAFSNEVPPLIEKATTDYSALNQLETKLTEMEKEIAEFNQLTPPEFAKDIHAQILEHNQALESAIKEYTENIKNNHLDPATLQNSELMKQIEELNKILEQLQNLSG